MGITKDTIKQEVKHSIWRTISVISVLLIVGGFAFGLSTIFKKPSQNIVAKKGSTVSVTQINKTSKFFIPFCEVGIEQQSSSKMGTFIKVGVRIEF